MSTKDFFRTLLKLFGLYILVISLFSILPNLSEMISYHDGWIGILRIFLIPAILLSIFCILVFYPDLIIRKLRLDKGFDQNYIPFDKLDPEVILKLGALIVGGLLLLQNISPFLSTTYYLLKASVPGALERDFMGFNPFDYKINLATNILNLIIGYLLVTNCDYVSKFLLPKKIMNH